jgi:hypothetical protein
LGGSYIRLDDFRFDIVVDYELEEWESFMGTEGIMIQVQDCAISIIHQNTAAFAHYTGLSTSNTQAIPESVTLHSTGSVTPS